MKAARGYVLLEAVAAMAVLSVGMVAVHHAMQESLITRAQARDFTQAQFLLRELVSELQLRPRLEEATQSGDYGEALPRFRWTYTVRRVELPQDTPRTLPVPYLVRIEATVSWTLRGRDYSRTTQTLCQPEKLPEPNARSL